MKYRHSMNGWSQVITGVEFNGQAGTQRATSHVTSNTLLPSEWRISQPYRDAIVSMPYGMQMRFASTNAPDVNHFSTCPSIVSPTLLQIKPYEFVRWNLLSRRWYAIYLSWFFQKVICIYSPFRYYRTEVLSAQMTLVQLKMMRGKKN